MTPERRAEVVAFLRDGERIAWSPEVVAKYRDAADELEAADRIASMAVCTWCGQEIPRRDPDMPERVLGHLETCEGHPMRALEADLAAKDARIAELEARLRGLVGAGRNLAMATPDRVLRAELERFVRLASEVLP